jgi:hypothetical protein
MGEVSAALGREREALALMSSADSTEPVEPAMATVLSRLLTRMNQPAEAEALAQSALDSARSGGNVGSQVFALVALAEARERLGQIEPAQRATADAQALLQPDANPRLRTQVTRARVLIALARNDRQAAQAAAAELLGQVGYPEPTRLHGTQSGDLQLLLAARVALASGRPADAAQLSATALELASAVARDPERSATVGEARLLLARAREVQYDSDGAHAAIHGAAQALRTGLAPGHPLALEAAALEARL